MDKSFLADPVEKVAENLLGCQIRRNGMEGMIVETEAYLEDDPASHAHPGKTERNRLMYETHGKVYVYLCYGIHHMLNFTADENGVGGVLVRAIEPLEGIEQMKENRGVEEKEKLCNGPGKVCEALEITKDMNGTDVGEEIELEQGPEPKHQVSPRIGINQAENRELRYYIPGNRYVSRR